MHLRPWKKGRGGHITSSREVGSVQVIRLSTKNCQIFVLENEITKIVPHKSPNTSVHSATILTDSQYSVHDNRPTKSATVVARGHSPTIVCYLP